MRHSPDIAAKVITSEALLKLTRNSEDAKVFTTPNSHISRRVIASSARIFEIVFIALSGAGIWAVYLSDFSPQAILLFLPVFLFVSISLPLLMQVNGLFDMQAYLRPFSNFHKHLLIWGGVFAVVLSFVFFTKVGESYSRLWIGSWAVGGFLNMFWARGLFSFFLGKLNSSGQLDRRAVLVGGGKPADDLLASLEATPVNDVSIIGIFDDRSDDRSPTQVRGLQKLGTVDELVDFARQTRVDMLIVTLPLVAENRLLQVMKNLWVLPVDIRLSAYSQKLRYKSRAYSYLGNVPMLDVLDKPLSGWNAILKSVEDKVIAVIALVFLLPVMGLVALAVKLDSRGPVLFKQKRYGFNNELIEVYKFRSMYVDQSDATASKLVTRDDPRVTRVGRFIRKTSLDELPQVFNVLKGDLSLVGPRPHATHAKAQNHLYYDVVDGYFARHRVKPGITGWAQINGWRGETDTKEKIERRVEHDLFYIENWSLLFDLYIMARTPFSLVETENAY